MCWDELSTGWQLHMLFVAFFKLHWVEQPRDTERGQSKVRRLGGRNDLGRLPRGGIEPGGSCQGSCVNNDVCVLSCSVVSPTLRPIDCSPPGSSAHGIFQARILEWVAISFSRDRTHIFCIADRLLLLPHQGRPWIVALRCMFLDH